MKKLLAALYQEAELLMVQGDHASAAQRFEALGSYSDAAQMAMYCKAIDAAETLGVYSVAVDALNTLGDFKDSKQLAAYYVARNFEAACLRQGRLAQGGRSQSGFRREERRWLPAVPHLQSLHPLA